VWVDREGREEPLNAPLNNYRYPKISPDGASVALTVVADRTDIQIWDIAHKTLTPLTFDTNGNIAPVWTPDGQRIAFFGTSLESDGTAGVFWKAANGTGKAEPLASGSTGALFPYCFSGDGKILAGAVTLDAQNFDIGILSMDEDREIKLLLHEEYLETQPRISPDGKWLAYTSGESGENEIYVRPFPNVDGGRWRVSTSGGDSPLWSPDGKELFYLVGNTEAVMRVAVETEPVFKRGNPETLFKGRYVGSYPADGTPWDIDPDGNRFLMIKPPVGADGAATETGPRKITIVLNWDEELKERVPVD
jgi:Tol biopolymer transport system component